MKNFSRTTALAVLLLPAFATGLIFPATAQAENVARFATAEAIKWRGGVVNVEPSMAFYQRQGYQGIWTGTQGLSKRGQQLVSVLNDAWLDGLEPLDYLGGFPDNPENLRGDQLMGAELFLSDAAIRFARDLYAGRTTPSVSEPDIVIERKKLDTIALLGSMDKNGPLAVTERLRPTHEQYNALRKSLIKTSDPAKRRQIIINMERWRWLPRNLGDKHIFVNTAAFLMYTRKDGKDIDRRKVIVGQEFHKTPIFSDNIKYSEFNPTWTVTPSIAGNEILPKLRQDPGYLSKKGYELYASWEGDAPKMNAAQIDWTSVNPKKFPYRIVQPAGPDNALGQVKFLFPNRFNVYLHDTANRALFDKQDRALSHGCIRVQDPIEFAKLLYNMDNNPAASKISDILQTKKTKGVNFQTPIPVHLTYFTTWVKDGKVQFFGDIYGRDKLIGNILFGNV